MREDEGGLNGRVHKRRSNDGTREENMREVGWGGEWRGVATDRKAVKVGLPWK